ncbi:hypothetical protein LCGC14_1198090 [marine sediment metagenome]|uniref:Uncharacterized protein n=1 Tax=marine sediment metagenome TaxID=412755 RepID=A0A0F9LM75_9ZZZZ
MTTTLTRQVQCMKPFCGGQLFLDGTSGERRCLLCAREAMMLKPLPLVPGSSWKRGNGKVKLTDQ